MIYGADLIPDDTIRIVLGAVGGYVSGRFIQTTAQTHAEEVTFTVLRE